MDGNRSQYLTSREFHDALSRLGSQIDNRFDKVDNILAETRERLAVVEAHKQAELDEIAELARERRVTKKQGFAWGSVATGAVLGVYKVVSTVFK